MANSYSEVEDKVRKIESELADLIKEQKDLVQDRSSILSKNYQHELLALISKKQKELEDSKNTLHNYRKTATNIRKLRELRDLRDQTKDAAIRREIDEEISTLEKETEESLNTMGGPLAEELGASYQSDNQGKVQSLNDGQSNNQPTGTPSQEDDQAEEPAQETAPSSIEAADESLNPQKVMDDQIEDTATTEGMWSLEEMQQRLGQATEELRTHIKILPDRLLNGLKEQAKSEDTIRMVDEELATREKQKLDASYQSDNQGNDQSPSDGQSNNQPADAARPETEQETTPSQTDTNNESLSPLQVMYDQRKEAYEKASEEYQTLIKKMQDVFAEEQRRREEEGPFPTEAALDSFNEEYMNRKIEIDEALKAARKNMFLNERRMKEAETALDNSKKSIIPLPSATSKQQEPIKFTPASSKENHQPRKVPNPGQTSKQKPGSAPIGIPLPKAMPLGLPSGEKPLGLPAGTTSQELPPKNPNNNSSPDKNQTPPLPPKKTPKKGLLTILDELTKDLKLAKGDGKHYRASNIKVAQEFKKELKSGNYLYNIVHFVPAIIKLPFKALKKLCGSIMYRATARANVKKLKERIANLPEEDLLTIYNEYRGSRVNQERFPTILNTLLDERIQQFALEKVAAINADLEKRYQKAFHAISTIQSIDEILRGKSDKYNIDETTKANLQKERASLIANQAQNIAAIREGYTKANQWLSGGAHGFSEDMRAATTKLSCVGKRFAKEHDLDNELLHRQAQLERAEMQAIHDGNDELALRTFIESEKLLSSNTNISNSLLGKRSTGKKYYSPLAEQLDYSDDPLIRDLFTTIAITSATISAVNAFNTHSNQGDVLAENRDIAARNNQTMDQVNALGRDIAGKRSEFSAGMKAQGYQDNLTAASEIERGVLDTTGWVPGTSSYRAVDDLGHEFYNNFYAQTEQSFEDIASQYASGAITQQQAMELISDVTASTHSTLANVTQECLKALKQHAINNPHFDLTGVKGAMEYLVENPTAIANMNKAMVDVTAAGDTLASLQLEQLAPLSELPSDLGTTLFAAASSAALAHDISRTVQESSKKGKYGNTVTGMVNEYVTSTAEASTKKR